MRLFGWVAGALRRIRRDVALERTGANDNRICRENGEKESFAVDRETEDMK